MCGRVLPVVVWIVLLTAGCNPSPRCLENTDVLLYGRFVTLNGEHDKDTVLQGTMIYGVGREDSLLYNGAVGKFILPLDAHRDSCAFVVAGPSLKDTLTFHYRRTTRLLSFECGFIAEFNDLRAVHTHHMIDSTAVINALVTNTNDENIKIYLFRH
jgi:hypothetical protein